MSAYRGRTGPNFSEFLTNLNSLSPYEEESFANDALDVDTDLAMFTNTDFTHFDIPSLPEDTGFNYTMNNDKPGEIKYQDLLAGADAQGFHPPRINTTPTDTPQYFSNYNTPIQPAPSVGFPIETESARQSQAGTNPRARKAESVESVNTSPEDPSRVAAEEDKRRRNTAASARFRVKKKQREQALERNVKDATDKNAKLEARLNQLEMENKWLKDLITEKNTIQSKEEIEQAFQKFKRESEEREVRIQPEHTTGVGTA